MVSHHFMSEVSCTHISGIMCKYVVQHVVGICSSETTYVPISQFFAA